MKMPVKPFGVSVVQCRGTPYEVGRAQARLFAATPKGRAFLRSKTRFPWWFKLHTEARVFAKFAPPLWEELAGLADELGIAMERAAYCFGNESMRPPIGACSAVMTAEVYGRNYDFRPRYYGAQFTLLQASGSFASIGSTHLLTGRLDGMNEHGLTIGLHRVKKRPRFPGLSADLIVRMVLDQCATTADAVALMRSLPHAMQYNYSLLDAGGVAAVVEASPGAVAVDRRLACLHQSFSDAAAPAAQPSSCRGVASPIAAAGGVGVGRPERGADVHGVEPVDVAGISPRLCRRRRHDAHPRRRAGQKAVVDRDRQRRSSPRRGHAGCEFRPVAGGRRFAGVAPPGPTRRNGEAVRMAGPAQEEGLNIPQRLTG